MTKQMTTLALSLATLAVACGDPSLVDEPVAKTNVALFDNDSRANPSIKETVGGQDRPELSFSDDISGLEGDHEDFVLFNLEAGERVERSIEVALDCDVYGDDTVSGRVELSDAMGNVMRQVAVVACNEGPIEVTIRQDLMQSARIYLDGHPEVQSLIDYTLTVSPL